MDHELKFHEHTLIVTAKANCTLGLIKKSFSYIKTDYVTIPESQQCCLHYLVDHRKVEAMQLY